MTRVLDSEGEHLAALRRLASFSGERVLELGCGDGRLTVPIAAEAAFVLAFDPDAEAVARARGSLPAELADRVALLGSPDSSRYSPSNGGVLSPVSPSSLRDGKASERR